MGVDNSKHAEATFAENNHAEFENRDLFHDLVRHKCDIITGGPPCKPWASVNVSTEKRSVNHRDHVLVGKFFKHVEMNNPDMFLFENVPPLQNDPILYKHKKRMEKIGYSVKGSIIRYSDFGASTSRRRLIIFGTRIGNAEIFFNKLEAKKKKSLTVKDVIWDLRNKGKGEVNDHVWPNLTTINKYKKYYRTHQYGWYILEWHMPAPSFGNIMKTYILHPQGFVGGLTRVISVREAMSIMGFDRNFRFPQDTGIGQRYQMTVDSVSPVFSYVSAVVIREIMNGLR